MTKAHKHNYLTIRMLLSHGLILYVQYSSTRGKKNIGKIKSL